MQTVSSPIIVALDFPSMIQAIDFAKTIDPKKVRVKVGKELFVQSGPVIVEKLQHLGFEVFLDLKFHDIPNTVTHACVEAAKLGVWMTDVHACGGSEMLEAVANKMAQIKSPPIIVAVTVLTSMNQAQFNSIGYLGSIEEQVLNLSKLTKESGLNGVVCSASEAHLLRQHYQEDFLLVTPGIRMPSDDQGDQKRIQTPKNAIDKGSSYLVIGRPITQAVDSNLAIDSIIRTL